MISITTTPCLLCRQTSVVEVDEASYVKWKSGALIQNAFPDLDRAQRELIMTGTHDVCWKKIFADADAGEGQP